MWFLSIDLIDHLMAVLLIIIELMTVSRKITVNITVNIYLHRTNDTILESYEKVLSNGIKFATRKQILKKL